LPDPEPLARFWTQLLGFEIDGRVGSSPVRPRYVVERPPPVTGVALSFQWVPEPKRAKNRVHLDVVAAHGLERFTRIVEELGGSRASQGAFDEHGWRWRVMTDPQGTSSALPLPSSDRRNAVNREVAARRVRGVIERLLADGSAVARADGVAHELFPVAIGEAEGQALAARVMRERAERTIEIGLGYGLSALFICEALIADGGTSPRHVAIDPNQHSRFSGCGLQFLEDAGVVDLVEFHPNGSEIVLPRLLQEGRPFDFAFVDGNHRFDAVLVDLFYLGRLVRPGSIVFLDDFQLPAIARAVSFFVSNVGWTIEDISPADRVHQWAVVRTSVEADDRPFDHFVDF
jgi:predicted O-methyltransferase YrrM